jgi:hypothetical protein
VDAVWHIVFYPNQPNKVPCTDQAVLGTREGRIIWSLINQGATMISDALKDQVQTLRLQYDSMKEFTIEVFKARQEFYQHLMLPNAGTLSLLLTVVLVLAATDRLSAAHLHDARPFLNGCSLLVASILLSLIHNHLNVNIFTHIGGSLMNSRVSGFRTR